MKLCIPIAVQPQGGMYTFVGNFLAWLAAAGHEVTRDIQGDYDALFVNSWVVSSTLVRREKRRRPGLVVVHRVDGAAEDYGGNPASDRIQARVNLYADVTIFQSRYSRHSVREKFHVIAQDGPVIYNPVDLALFAPDESHRTDPQRPRVACASWSVNPKKGTWQIDQLAERRLDVTFVLCGRFDQVATRQNVERLGHLDRAQMAAALRSCDVFLNLSENDPCPNVVIEALAAGLPVLYKSSGGVPELVGDCGEAIDLDTFDGALQRTLANRDHLAKCARRRAVDEFAPARIFPLYWKAIATAVRRPLPTTLGIMKLATTGYPILPRARSAADLAGAVVRRGPGIMRALGGRRTPAARVGWITYDSFSGRKQRLGQLDSFTGMRVGNVARWINANDDTWWNELYVPDRRYDIVVFQKVMDARAQAEADKIRAYGGRVIFDANVNYYDVWGDYVVEGTRPTDEQRRDARRMTASADWVVADSSYLLDVIKPLNHRVTWIPDNVNTGLYRGSRAHQNRPDPLRLVWSGIAKKSAHLLEIRDVLGTLRDAELMLVADERPHAMSSLEQVIPCRYVHFSDRRYAQTLLTSDVIISPKRLVNAYEMAHTEYKITLGMAVALPALASPQQSYCEAVDHRGGGIICKTTVDWMNAFERVRDASTRAALGERAQQTVLDKYSTPVVAAQYLTLLRQLAPAHAGSAQVAR
jgi:glycosyltransferase involved in cell wall biosynthesis